MIKDKNIDSELDRLSKEADDIRKEVADFMKSTINTDALRVTSFLQRINETERQLIEILTGLESKENE